MRRLHMLLLGTMSIGGLTAIGLSGSARAETLRPENPRVSETYGECLTRCQQEYDTCLDECRRGDGSTDCRLKCYRLYQACYTRCK
jgi:hypothetical protein